MPLEKGRTLGPYLIIEALGAGGMGEVYRARDPRLERDVAIKVLPAGYADEPESIARFRRESKAIAALSHPNLIAVYDVGEAEGLVFIVMELLSGETLRARLRRDRLDVRTCAQVARAVAAGLAAAHDAHLVHRDVKPENVFLLRSGDVKVLDFGLAKPKTAGHEASAETLTDALTDPGVAMGTPGYMAPEQIQGKAVDHRADVFALGAVLYEMLAGRPAFKGPNAADTFAATLRDGLPPIETFDSRVASLLRIAERCVAKEPRARFQSAQDLAFAIDNAASLPTPHAGTAHSTTPSRRARWWPWVVGLGAVAALGIAAVARIEMRRTEPVSPERVSVGRGRIFHGRFGPDGTSVFYSASIAGADSEVFEVRIGTRDRRALRLAPANLVSISSRQELAVTLRPRFPLTYFEPGTLATVPPSGASPRSLLDGVSVAEWLPGGTELLIARTTDRNTTIEWPLGQPVAEVPGVVSQLRISPDGQRAALGIHGNKTRVALLTRDGAIRTVADGLTLISGLAFHPNGEVWFSGIRGEGRNEVRAIRSGGAERVVLTESRSLALDDIDARGRALVRAVTFVLETQIEDSGGISDASIDMASSVESFADDGSVLVNETRDLYVRRPDGSVTRVFEDTGRYRSSLSADGKWFATIREGSSPPTAQAQAPVVSPQVLVMAPVGTGETVKVPLPRGGGRPVWLPDDSGVLLVSTSDRETSILRVLRSTGRIETIGSLPEPSWNGFVVSRDGKRAAASLPDGIRGSRFAVLDLSRPSAWRLIEADQRLDRPINLSADGRTLFAYLQGEMPAVIRGVDLSTGHVADFRSIRLGDTQGAWRVHPIVMDPRGERVAYSVARDLSDLFVYAGLR